MTSEAMASLSIGVGAMASWVYSFHCGENGLMFLALWYTLGVAVVATLGALLGRAILRW